MPIPPSQLPVVIQNHRSSHARSHPAISRCLAPSPSGEGVAFLNKKPGLASAGTGTGGGLLLGRRRPPWQGGQRVAHHEPVPVPVQDEVGGAVERGRPGAPRQHTSTAMPARQCCAGKVAPLCRQGGAAVPARWCRCACKVAPLSRSQLGSGARRGPEPPTTPRLAVVLHAFGEAAQVVEEAQEQLPQHAVPGKCDDGGAGHRREEDNNAAKHFVWQFLLLLKYVCVEN